MPTAQGYAVDGSGYYAVVSNYTNLQVWDPAGTLAVNLPFPSVGESNTAVVDRNGNKIQYGVDGEVASDSLQHTPIHETVASTDGDGNPLVIYLDVPIVQIPNCPVYHYLRNHFGFHSFRSARFKLCCRSTRKCCGEQRRRPGNKKLSSSLMGPPTHLGMIRDVH